jgi:hypothetical protein
MLGPPWDVKEKAFACEGDFQRIWESSACTRKTIRLAGAIGKMPLSGLGYGLCAYERKLRRCQAPMQKAPPIRDHATRLAGSGTSSTSSDSCSICVLSFPCNT